MCPPKIRSLVMMVRVPASPQLNNQLHLIVNNRKTLLLQLKRLHQSLKMSLKPGLLYTVLFTYRWSVLSLQVCM